MQSTELIYLSQNLARKRRLAGITQPQIAEAIGISNSTYSRWEGDNFKNAKLSYIIKIVKYLELWSNDNKNTPANSSKT